MIVAKSCTPDANSSGDQGIGLLMLWQSRKGNFNAECVVTQEQLEERIK